MKLATWLLRKCGAKVWFDVRVLKTDRARSYGQRIAGPFKDGMDAVRALNEARADSFTPEESIQATMYAALGRRDGTRCMTPVLTALAKGKVPKLVGKAHGTVLPVDPLSTEAIFAPPTLMPPGKAP